MLTTVDNPYDPRAQYDEWLAFDHEHGYYTQELLARVAPIDDNETDKTYEIILNEAIRQIVDSDSLGIFKVV